MAAMFYLIDYFFCVGYLIDYCLFTNLYMEDCLLTTCRSELFTMILSLQEVFFILNVTFDMKKLNCFIQK
jgi:hypothetical protein